MNTLPLCASILASLALSATGGETTPAKDDCCKRNWITGEGVSLGGVLFPEINYQTAFGTASTDPARLAIGHHDPDRKGFTQQNIEFSLGARLGENVRLFSTYNTKIDLDDHWDDDIEEYYAVFSGLPGGLTFKGGRFFALFGYQNTQHLHDYTFIDQYLANGRLIGDESITLYGGELSLPVLRGLPAGWGDRLTLTFGAVPVEGGGGEEVLEIAFDPEGAKFKDWTALADYTVSFAATNHTRCETGLSGAWGKNNDGRSTQLYSLHTEYLWQPAGVAHCATCGQSAQGEFLRWRTELMLRNYGAANEGARRDFTNFGAYTALSYGLPGEKVQAHLRGEYVSGTAETGQGERWRVSPAISWTPSAELPIHFKLQYNYDHSPSFGDEHSVWAQFGITWGDCCAHEH